MPPLIQAAQMIQLGEVDMALAGGISESVGSFGIFASFKAQNALAEAADPRQASRPFDLGRNGIVISEGGCIYVIESMDRALARNAKSWGNRRLRNELRCPGLRAALRAPAGRVHAAGPQAGRTAAGERGSDQYPRHRHQTRGYRRMQGDPRGLRQFDIDLHQQHQEQHRSRDGRRRGPRTGRQSPLLEDHLVHPTINIDQLDPECSLPNLVVNSPIDAGAISVILNNSFGMVGINSTLIVGKFEP